MAIRWRKNGELICAAMSDPEDGDTYIGDRLSYELTAELQVIVADPNHKTNGLWYWTRDALIVANPKWKRLGKCDERTKEPKQPDRESCRRIYGGKDKKSNNRTCC